MSVIGLKLSGTFFLSLHKIIIMKIKLLVPMVKNGKEIEAGSVMDIPDANAPKWIAKGWGEPVGHKKEHKAKKETKELKIDSKDSK